MNIETIKKEGYNLHLIKNNNFKSIFIKIMFWNELKEEELIYRNMLLDNLLFSSSKYDTHQKMSKKSQDLYNAELFGETYRKGTQVISQIGFSVIEDKYTEKGNVKEAIEFLFNCINNPNVKNGAFDKTTFNTIKEITRSAIKGEKDKPGYQAYIGLKEEIGSKNIYAGSIYGPADSTSKVNESNLYEYYKTFFNNNHIDIFVLGNITDEIESQITKHMKVEKTDIPYTKVSTDYEKKLTIKEKTSTFNQSVLMMGASLKKIQTDIEKSASSIYNIIFGSSPSSKLFTNIREKLSYAYSIGSSINSLDGIMIVEAGISSKNYMATKEQVLKEMDNMRKGLFTNKDIKTSKEVILSVIKDINDSPWGIINHHFNRLYFKARSLEKQKEEISNVTKEDIIKVAKKINIDTIFLLKEDQNGKD